MENTHIDVVMKRVKSDQSDLWLVVTVNTFNFNLTDFFYTLSDLRAIYVSITHYFVFPLRKRMGKFFMQVCRDNGLKVQYQHLFDRHTLPEFLKGKVC